MSLLLASTKATARQAEHKRVSGSVSMAADELQRW